MPEREWLYRLVLQLYPPDFRATFLREMVLVYRDQQRDGLVNARFWLTVVADATGAAPRLWLEELYDGLLMTEATVKIMAVFAILIGGLETLNSLAESRAAAFGGRDPLSQVMLVLAIAAAVLLTVAGLAMLVRGPSARKIGWIGALGCLGVFALMAATRPMMSVAATLAGLVFPAVMMAFLYVKGDRAVA